MNERCIRRVDDLPARAASAKAEVDLFAKQEEALVKPSDLVDQLASDNECGAHEPIDFTHRRVVESSSIERVEQPTRRRKLAQKEVLGAKTPHARKSSNRKLLRPVLAQKTRTGDANPRIADREVNQCLESVINGPGVRVDKREVGSRSTPHAKVVGGAEANVCVRLDQRCLGKTLSHQVRTSVTGPVVDDDDLVSFSIKRRQTALQDLASVMGDDDDADYLVVHETTIASRGGTRGDKPSTALPSKKKARWGRGKNDLGPSPRLGPYARRYSFGTHVVAAASPPR